MTRRAMRLITASVIAGTAYVAGGMAMASIVVPGAQSTFKPDAICGSLNISVANLASAPITCRNEATHDGGGIGTFSAQGTPRTFFSGSEDFTASVDLAASLVGSGSGQAQAEAHLI